MKKILLAFIVSLFVFACSASEDDLAKAIKEEYSKNLADDNMEIIGDVVVTHVNGNLYQAMMTVKDKDSGEQENVSLEVISDGKSWQASPK